VNSADDRPPLGAVRERVLAELRERIVAGTLQPGDRLVERELAEDFGVSRAPVREAIRTLAAEGFVVVRSPRRIEVRGLSRTDVEELFDVREALEVLAGGLAAQRAGAAEHRRLAKLLAAAARATATGRAAQITAANNAFHDEIVAIAGNSLLSKTLRPIEARLRWLTRQNEHWADLLAEHRALYAAIASGEADRARECAQDHVRRNRIVTLASLFGDAPKT
jgi:DNA-binding GntR family transcriptional regulator